MKWKKLGLIFDPKALESMSLTAALMPTVEILDAEKNLVRVYFSPRNTRNQSEVRYFDIDISRPHQILKISENPLLLPGKKGAFDDSGITLGSIVRVQEKKFLFYTGWNLTVSVPMNNSIGIAKFDSSDRLARFGDGPILTRSLYEPYSCASPFVLFENGLFRMWYASMDHWKPENDGSHRHYYNIKYAESSDGLHWEKSGRVAINYENESEYAFGRPFVLKEHGIYKMWYAFRGQNYRIGYAESSDGIQWSRKDKEMDFDVSSSGWDSQMIEYPFILDHKGTRYMFYNGNDYGKSGIGLAEMMT